MRFVEIRRHNKETIKQRLERFFLKEHYDPLVGYGERIKFYGYVDYEKISFIVYYKDGNYNSYVAYCKDVLQQIYLIPEDRLRVVQRGSSWQYHVEEITAGEQFLERL